MVYEICLRLYFDFKDILKLRKIKDYALTLHFWVVPRFALS